MNIVDNRFEIWPNPVSGYTGDSESERLGLLYYTNINVNPLGYFEAANPAVAARIDSQIDLRGIVSDYTVVVDFEAETLSALQCQQLAGQGAAVAGRLAICSLGYYKLVSDNSFRLLISHEIGGVRAFYYPIVPELSGRHIVSGRVSLGVSSTTLSIFLDGVLIGSQTYSGLPTGMAYSTNYAINDNRNGNYTNFFGKFYAAALFNRALSDSQINMISRG